MTAAREDLAPEHEEARGVVVAILDRADHDFLQAVDMTRGLACDRRGVVGIARAPCAFGIARYRNLLGLGQIRAQPCLGLRERLRMRIDAFDVFDVSGARQQVLAHAQFDFAADFQILARFPR